MLPFVVQVLGLEFGLDTSIQKRRIFIECWNKRDEDQARKAAFVLSKIMKERLSAKSAAGSPTGMPLIIPGRFRKTIPSKPVGDNGG